MKKNSWRFYLTVEQNLYEKENQDTDLKGKKDWLKWKLKMTLLKGVFVIQSDTILWKDN